jgi:hypothetical protein
VAVPRFRAESSSEAGEVQRVILTSLRDHFPNSGHRILPVWETVGPEDTSFATSLRARLGCLYLVFGEVRGLGRKLSVYARVLGPGRGILHRDTFTEDVTPQRTLWRTFFHRLTPTHDPDQTEYPFDFTTEIETIVQSMEGKVLLALDRPEEAERVLTDTLRPVRGSESHAVDLVRLDMVEALERQGREHDAMQLMRARAYARSDSNLGDLVGRYAELGMTEFLCFPEANDQQPLMEDVANSLPRSANRLGREDGMSHTPALTDRQSSGRCTASVAPVLRGRRHCRARRMWSPWTPPSLPDLSTRRRREHCKNPNAAGRAVWVDARAWGCVA